MSSLRKLLEKIKKVDIFSLGLSSFLYYFLIFLFVPLLIIGGGFLGLKIFDYGGLSYLSLLYLAVGFIMLLLGYYSFFGKKLARKIPQIFKSEWRPEKVSWVFGVTFVLGFLAKIIQFLTGGYFFAERGAATWKYVSFYSALQIFDWLSLVALTIAFLWCYHLKKQGDENYKAWRNVAWGTFIFIVLFSLPMCSKVNIIIPIVLILISRWYVLKKSYTSVLLAFLGVLLLFPFSSVCRSPAALVTHSIVRVVTVDDLGEPIGDDKSMGDGGVYERVFKVLYEDYYKKPYEEPVGVEYNIDSGKALNFAVNSFLGRISQHKILQGIIENPRPLLYGKPFLSFFISLGPPRFIWKSKPIITPDGNAFGRRVGIINPNDHSTFIGVTNVGDWYMNFGLSGIIFGMFLTGMLFRFIYEYLITKPTLFLSGVMVYGFAWINLIKGMEHSIAPLYAGTVKFVVVLAIIHLFLVYDKNDLKEVVNKFLKKRER